jgi:hypothetical protein
MRSTIFLLCLASFHMTSFGQKVSYNIPEGYENDITREDYKKLVDHAVAAVGKRYSIDNVKGGTIFLKKDQEIQQLNLDNLILKCVAIEDKSQWNKVVQVHFENLFSTIDAQKEIDPENYESIKKYLSLRIYPAAFLNQRGGTSSLITRTDLEDTYTLLMLDLPNAFTPVQRKMFSLWKTDTAEVFRIAQDNVNKQEIEKVSREFDVDGTNVEFRFLGNEDYAASYALDLANNSPDFVGEWGSVVAIPNKGLVNICKVSKDKPLDFVKFIQRIKSRVEQSYQEHQQPISDQFYWYYHGEFTRINVMTQPDGNINVISPFGLTELMTEKK